MPVSDLLPTSLLARALRSSSSGTNKDTLHPRHQVYKSKSDTVQADTAADTAALNIHTLETPVKTHMVEMPMSSMPPSIVELPHALLASRQEPPQPDETDGEIYDEVVAEIKFQTGLFFAELSTSWIRDVLPNVVALIADGLYYATHAKVGT